MLILKSKLDLGGHRWIEPIEGLKLKVGSIDSPAFSSASAYIQRHIQRQDENLKVGTPDFNVLSVGSVANPNDYHFEACAAHLIQAWEGVGEAVDGKEVTIEYTPERGLALLKQHPELYWPVLEAGIDIAKDNQEQKKEILGKS